MSSLCNINGELLYVLLIAGSIIFDLRQANLLLFCICFGFIGLFTENHKTAGVSKSFFFLQYISEQLRVARGFLFSSMATR